MKFLTKELADKGMTGSSPAKSMFERGAETSERLVVLTEEELLQVAGGPEGEVGNGITPDPN